MGLGVFIVQFPLVVKLTTVKQSDLGRPAADDSVYKTAKSKGEAALNGFQRSNSFEVLIDGVDEVSHAQGPSANGSQRPLPDIRRDSAGKSKSTVYRGKHGDFVVAAGEAARGPVQLLDFSAPWNAAGPAQSIQGDIQQDEWDTVMELDVEGLVRKEMALLKADGYLAGHASFHKGASNEFMMLTFPCDEVHASYILAVLEDLGLGREFGNVIVVPALGGAVTYKHHGWNNPEERLSTVIADAKAVGGAGPGTWASCLRTAACLPARAARSLSVAISRRGATGGPPAGAGGDKAPKVAQMNEKRRTRRDLRRKRACKLRVEQMVARIQSGAVFDFDYATYLFAAGVIAAVGLGMNSVALVVASMLVSPLMGPIMAMTVAVNLRMERFALTSLRDFLLSVLVLLCTGFLAAIVGYPFVSNADDWPTTEMTNRSGGTTLLASAVIGLVSGAGVALSTLANNGASLVGVAISASLLPPAVNCGMAWGMAAVANSMRPAWPVDAAAWFRLGGESLAITVINVATLILAGALFFGLKDVAPSKERHVFWWQELKDARDARRAAVLEARPSA